MSKVNSIVRCTWICIPLATIWNVKRWRNLATWNRERSSNYAFSTKYSNGNMDRDDKTGNRIKAREHDEYQQMARTIFCRWLRCQRPHMDRVDSWAISSVRNVIEKDRRASVRLNSETLGLSRTENTGHVQGII